MVRWTKLLRLVLLPLRWNLWRFLPIKFLYSRLLLRVRPVSIFVVYCWHDVIFSLMWLAIFIFGFWNSSLQFLPLNSYFLCYHRLFFFNRFFLFTHLLLEILLTRGSWLIVTLRLTHLLLEILPTRGSWLIVTLRLTLIALLLLPLGIFRTLSEFLIFYRYWLFFHYWIFFIYWNRFFFSLIFMPIFRNILVFDNLSDRLSQVWSFLLGDCFSILINFWFFIIIDFVILILQKFNIFTELIIVKFSFFIHFIERKDFLILGAAKIPLIDEDLQLMGVFILNVEGFEILLPVFGKIGD